MHKFLRTLTEKRVRICVIQSMFSFGSDSTSQQPMAYGSKIKCFVLSMNERSADPYLTANWPGT